MFFLITVLEHDTRKPGFEGRPAFKPRQIEKRLNIQLLHEIFRVRMVALIRPYDTVQVRIVASDEDLKKSSVSRSHLVIISTSEYGASIAFTQAFSVRANLCYTGRG